MHHRKAAFTRPDTRRAQHDMLAKEALLAALALQPLRGIVDREIDHDLDLDFLAVFLPLDLCPFRELLAQPYVAAEEEREQLVPIAEGAGAEVAFLAACVEEMEIAVEVTEAGERTVQLIRRRPVLWRPGRTAAIAPAAIDHLKRPAGALDRAADIARAFICHSQVFHSPSLSITSPGPMNIHGWPSSAQ